MTISNKWWMVGVLGVALAAGCAADGASEPGVAELDVEETGVSVDLDEDLEPVSAKVGTGPDSATNCVVVEWCNAPEWKWPGVGTLCRKSKTRPCTRAQARAECVTDAIYVCGAVIPDMAVYTPL
jgi:hypothetical protein